MVILYTDYYELPDESMLYNDNCRLLSKRKIVREYLQCSGNSKDESVTAQSVLVAVIYNYASVTFIYKIRDLFITCVAYFLVYAVDSQHDAGGRATL